MRGDAQSVKCLADKADDRGSNASDVNNGGWMNTIILTKPHLSLAWDI